MNYLEPTDITGLEFETLIEDSLGLSLDNETDAASSDWKNRIWDWQANLEYASLVAWGRNELPYDEIQCGCPIVAVWDISFAFHHQAYKTPLFSFIRVYDKLAQYKTTRAQGIFRVV